MIKEKKKAGIDIEEEEDDSPKHEIPIKVLSETIRTAKIAQESMSVFSIFNLEPFLFIYCYTVHSRHNSRAQGNQY